MFEGTIKAKVLIFGAIAETTANEEGIKERTVYPNAWVALPPVYFTGHAQFQDQMNKLLSKYQHIEIEVRGEASPTN